MYNDTTSTPPLNVSNSDDEVLANVADDNEAATVMSATVAGAHNGSEPPPNPRQIGHGCRGVGGQKAIRGGREGGRDGGRKGVLKETRNLALKKAVDEYGVQKIRFEWNDQGTMLQIGPNAAQWSNLVGKLVREFPMHYPSWSTIEASKKAHIIRRLMEEMIKLRDLEADTSTGVPYTEKEILAMMESSESHEYPSLISSFYDTYTHDGVWVHKEAQLQYEEMIKLRDLEADTSTGVPYTEKEILAMVRKGKHSQKEIGEDSKGGDGSKSGGGETGGGEDDQPSEDETSAGMMMRVISIYGFRFT
ncbi:hypothetical protein Tco_0209360 [Tanacetum coccineum]